MAHYRFVETEDGMSVLERKVEGQPDTWVEDMKSPTPFFWIASKKYVNDKIKEANPDFKGTFDDMADIEALEDVNANDWAYLVTQDENLNDVYNRYRYTIPDGETEYTWLFEVAIKRDNFTDEEWAAITSGITSDKVQNMIIAMSVTDITALTGEQIDSLEAGYVVNKVTGGKKHSYVIKYKKDDPGEMSLVYCDHENVEEVYYEKRNGSWTYVQTDITPIAADHALVGDAVLIAIERDNDNNFVGVYRTLDD